MMKREVEQRLSAVEGFERMMSRRAKPRLYPENSKWRIDQAISLVSVVCFAEHFDDFIGRWKPTPKSRSKTLAPTGAFRLVDSSLGACLRAHARMRAHARENVRMRGAEVCGVQVRCEREARGVRERFAAVRVSGVLTREQAVRR